MYPMLPVSLDCPFLLSLGYSLTFICPVSCVPYVASFSGLPFFIAPSVFSNIYLSCVLCTLCCQFLRISYLLLLRYSLAFICPVSCVPYVACFSGFSFLLSSRFSLTFISPVSCVPYFASFFGFSFFISPSVFTNIYFFCVLCTLCC